MHVLLFRLKRKFRSCTCTFGIRFLSKLAAHFFKNSVVIYPNGEVFERDIYNSEVYVPLRRSGGIVIHQANVEITETRLMVKNLKPDSIVFDVGANIGYQALRLCQGAGAFVYAFEPVSDNFNVLQKNIYHNNLDKRITPFPIALGAHQGKVYIMGGVSTGNRIEPHQRKGVQEVLLDTIDTFVIEHNITRVALIKCDVEGYELEVLKGATQVLMTLRPLIMIEIIDQYGLEYGYGVKSSEIWNYLKGMNYKGGLIADGHFIAANDDNWEVLSRMPENNYLFYPLERENDVCLHP